MNKLKNNHQEARPNFTGITNNCRYKYMRLDRECHRSLFIEPET